MRKRLLLVAITLCAALTFAACSSDEETKRVKYTIDASISDDYILTSTVTVDYVNNTDVPLDEVWFHIYPNAFREGAKYCPVPSDRLSEAYSAGRNYSVMKVNKVLVDGGERDINVGGEDENVLIVSLPATLDPTSSTRIVIDYTVKLPLVRHRFGYTDKSINLANFYPVACEYSGGQFAAYPYYSSGDPFYSACADYSVTLSVPKKFKCAATGEMKSTEGENETVYSGEAQNVRDFAAVLGEYEKTSGLSGETIVNYMYYSDSAPEKSLGAAIDAVRVFSEKFGAYPYKEYTVVQTGFYQGGMEYPALSMISDRMTGDAALDVIVHETAHQWWYSLVGNDQVKHAWLDEALAEYSTMMFYDNVEGYKYTFEGKRADALSAYMLYCETYKHNGKDDTSMTRAVNEYADETEYTYMTYVKGALMLDDVKNTVGGDAFTAGLKKYCETNKYKIARPEDLIGAMEKASGRQLKPLFDSWLNGNVKLYSSH